MRQRALAGIEPMHFTASGSSLVSVLGCRYVFAAAIPVDDVPFEIVDAEAENDPGAHAAPWFAPPTP